MIKNMENAIDSFIDESASTYSKGEKQNRGQVKLLVDLIGNSLVVFK